MRSIGWLVLNERFTRIIAHVGRDVLDGLDPAGCAGRKQVHRGRHLSRALSLTSPASWTSRPCTGTLSRVSTERLTDRQTDSRVGTETGRLTDRQTDWDSSVGTESGKLMDSRVSTETGRQTNRRISTETDKQADRLTVLFSLWRNRFNAIKNWKSKKDKNTLNWNGTKCHRNKKKTERNEKLVNRMIERDQTGASIDWLDCSILCLTQSLLRGVTVWTVPCRHRSV